MQTLLSQRLTKVEDIEAKKEVTSKLLAANKAKAAALLQAALNQLEASKPTVKEVVREIK